MTGERRRTPAKAVSPVSAFALVVCALLLAAGCAQDHAKAPRSVETVSAPVDSEETILLKRLEVKFENPDAQFELGQLYHRQSRWAKAEYHYGLALGFDPAHRAAQAALVRMLGDSGKTAKAEQYSQSYIGQVSSSPRELLRLGEAFEEQALDEYALVAYQRALRAAPNSPEVNNAIGYYYLGKGDKTRAKEYLSRSFELSPNQPAVAGALGRLGVVVKVPYRAERDTAKADTPAPMP
ncbi:MAG: tetratricopeptide repeat protein [Phycisphaerales bacterium]|nr:MAG: tetratricopeptide repeat protein [Phycisphaerales bacterium]